MEKYIEFLELVISFVKDHMDFGTRPCPLCGSTYFHHTHCLYLTALDLLHDATAQHEE